MSLLHRYIKILLSELRIVGTIPTDDEPFNIFAYKDKLFIIKDLSRELPNNLEDYYDPEYSRDIEHIRTEIGRERAHGDFIVGFVDPNKVLFLKEFTSMSPNPETSQLLKKVIKQLRIKKVSKLTFDVALGDDVTTDYKTDKLTSDIPDEAYHGTSSENLFKKHGILSVGLRPGAQVGGGNFPRVVKHDKAVSLDYDMNAATFYADKATRKGGFPIIIKFKIPDKERIVPDFDVDSYTGKEYYDAGIDNTLRPGRGALKTSIDVGRIGYEGRIPPSFMKEFLFFSKVNNEWQKVDLSELRYMYDMAKDFGEDNYESKREEFEDTDDNF